ncbi:MAG: hypothetical protein MRZ40_05355 [Ligilactobacillus animalis]|uniref:hypothetical protein n=1 Tax=Ligilactobacillus animalis TaxID=1605 RepID=UPI00242D44DE|nr:hypothetical protein [Ligilactobacillus animalis]MCI5941980.1 hypothetical protein [Ligilactobacillus animalis]MDY2992176.1 hypothetical protein [Ligilactobacillus animalis]
MADGKLTYYLKNGKEVSYKIPFTLNDFQKENLTCEFLKRKDTTDLKKRPIKMDLTSLQKKQILEVHNELIDSFKSIYEEDGKLEIHLLEDEIVVFTDHAVQRIRERILENSVAQKIKKKLNLGESSSEEEKLELVRGFLNAKEIEGRVEWNYYRQGECRINFKVYGEKTTIVASINLDNLVVTIVTIELK